MFHTQNTHARLQLVALRFISGDALAEHESDTIRADLARVSYGLSERQPRARIVDALNPAA